MSLWEYYLISALTLFGSERFGGTAFMVITPTRAKDQRPITNAVSVSSCPCWQPLQQYLGWCATNLRMVVGFFSPLTAYPQPEICSNFVCDKPHHINEINEGESKSKHFCMLCTQLVNNSSDTKIEGSTKINVDCNKILFCESRNESVAINSKLHKSDKIKILFVYSQGSQSFFSLFSTLFIILNTCTVHGQKSGARLVILLKV